MTNSSDEIQVIIPKGCDNAPRKQIVIDFTLAVLKGQVEVIQEYADESIVWNQLKDNRILEGQDSLIKALQTETRKPIVSVEIYQVITHGKFASINGLITMAEGTKIDFCDVLVFSNAAKSGKLKEIKSYVLQS